MPNDGTGNNWDESDPGNTDIATFGPQEIRDLRIGVRDRTEKEHETFAGSGAGGEHKAGSAKVYYQSGVPTTRPDGTTLSSADTGRLWLDNDNGVLYYYVHPTWFSVFSAASVIGTAQIADNTITSLKIVSEGVETINIKALAVTNAKIDSVAYSKVTGAPAIPTTLPPNGSAGGDLTGTYPNPTIAAGAVTNSKISPGNVGTTELQDAGVTAAKQASGLRSVFGTYFGDNTSGHQVETGISWRIVHIYNRTTGTVCWLCSETTVINTMVGAAIGGVAGSGKVNGTTTFSKFVLNTTAVQVNATGNDYDYIAFG